MSAYSTLNIHKTVADRFRDAARRYRVDNSVLVDAGMRALEMLEPADRLAALMGTDPVPAAATHDNEKGGGASDGE